MVDRRFFRVRYDFRRAARRFQEDVKRCLTVEAMGNLLVERISTLLPLEHIGLLLIHGQDSARIIGRAGDESSERDALAILDHQVGEPTGNPLALADAVEPGVPFEQADARSFASLGIVMLYPLVRSDATTVAMLLLGSKKAGTRFTNEDVDLLGNLAATTGMEMDRILLQLSVVEKADEAIRLQRLNTMKSEFVSYVSHELRTPLTSIKMFAELLSERLPGQDRRAREYVNIIEGESDRLQRMVNTILDSAKIDRGETQYHLRSVRLDSLLRAVLRTMKYQVNKEGFVVKLELAGKIRVASNDTYRIFADPDAVSEAVLNLLTNAMKYSGGSKQIRIRLARSTKEIRCSVADSGLGIPPEAQTHLFEKFFRDPSLPRRIQGVGLGLSIVKHIMNAHGGSVDVESTLHKGSTFTLVFPVPRKRANKTHPPKLQEGVS
jgi:signal transduction histidine kinase